MIGKIPEIKKEKKAPSKDMIWSKFGNTMASITMIAEVERMPIMFISGFLQLDLDIQ